MVCTNGIRDCYCISLQKHTGITIAKSIEHRVQDKEQIAKRVNQKAQSKEQGIRSEKLYF
jgi:hypothetical protein